MSKPTPSQSEEALKLQEARDEFVAQWGTMGSAWGVNRTMAQIHALLMITTRPLSTDDIMEDLRISRGNAHMNLRELVGWGLVRSVIRKGERKEFFEAEKDVWKMFCIIIRERKRREIQPAIAVLKGCIERVNALKSDEAEAFSTQTKALCKFMETADSVLSRVARSEESTVLPWALNYLAR
ncbi:MAG: transcriptional regulator [Chthoniobacteraceae bacterium]|nr:transcriptional regulator [Chthoniobacteraceae bacterium]